MKKVITIEPARPVHQVEETSVFTRRRVAGYARVSTDHEEQATSYEAQMKYYTDYINSRIDWEFVKMYSDEGITGTNTKSRMGFKEMINDALDGKIDLIITKSVSRFARNTVDSLSTVRKLKEHGVEIYFEKENIWTFDSKGELLITIMSSLAQEESRSISENVKWGKRKQFERGKVSIPFKSTLGFQRGEHGELVVNQEEAKLVRYIFHEFLTGKNCNTIAKSLTEKGILTPMGKTKWTFGTIKRILQNEKYKGDALLQKTFVTDFLTKSTKVNEGELPQYYVENNHEAIIEKEVFELVQVEFVKQKQRKSSKTLFSGKLICESCGAAFGSKVWHSNSKYRRVVYRCNHKYDGDKKCKTPHVIENEVKQWFIEAMNQVIENKAEILANLEALRKVVANTSELDSEISRLETELTDLTSEVEQLISDNTRTIQDQTSYQNTYNQLASQYEEKKAELERLKVEKADKQKRAVKVKDVIDTFTHQQCLLTAFDEKLWNTMVEQVIITKEKSAIFTFKSGQEIII
ncbi:recombinase family protein [Streptococcus himalayensis]|uniref:Serine recombinase n=1 Tax=Streptococcus himalayensis TaxID=1888195 RepID=A0A917EFA2_9STRE|nr:recombinase family protein [Streptococcus himalayensis]QBX16516.1 site-specific recombinase [Streptococcus phage Javan255]GGE26786.1 serine recombinase [Streptococcus himalayensis]